jgi:putative restriction endonuclease
MRAFIGVTDPRWFEFLRAEQWVEEVNFWKPSGAAAFRAIEPGELFLFKKGEYIVGGGIFSHALTEIPCSLAWRTFGRLNGAADLGTLKEHIAGHRPDARGLVQDYRIGCRILLKPVFLPDSAFIQWPWGRNFGPGLTKDLADQTGQALLERLRPHLQSRPIEMENQHLHAIVSGSPHRFGTPFLTRARLGQGAFRSLVIDAYGRRCAVTKDKTLPALEAAHIKPVSEGGYLTVTNGLLLRADLHTLFDAGYVTVTPEYQFKVSPKIREEYDNGVIYYNLERELEGRPIHLPGKAEFHPDRSNLEWHSTERFLA